MKRLIISLFCLFGLASTAIAQPLTILTESDPPAQIVSPSGELSGYTIELVHEIQKLVGNNDPIKVLPWARAYQMIERGPRVVLFLMSRTKERNPLFQWVGPVMELEFGLYGKADTTLKLASLEDAKKVSKIGVYRDDARDQILTAAGFNNLQRTNTLPQNVKMIMLGRLDLYAGSSLTYADDARMAGYKPSDLKLVLPFKKIQVYIAMSSDMPVEIVNDWNNALDTLKQNGTFQKLWKKYYPHAAVPGPANNEFD